MESFIPGSEGEMKTCVLKYAIWLDLRVSITEIFLTTRVKQLLSEHYSVIPWNQVYFIPKKILSVTLFQKSLSPSNINAYQVNSSEL